MKMKLKVKVKVKVKIKLKLKLKVKVKLKPKAEGVVYISAPLSRRSLSVALFQIKKARCFFSYKGKVRDSEIETEVVTETHNGT